MKLKYLLGFAVFSALVFLQCDRTPSGPYPSDWILTPINFYDSLCEIDSLNKLVTSVEEAENHYIIKLEDQTELKVLARAIESYSVQAEDWNVEFILKDATSKNLGYLGNDFYRGFSVSLNPENNAPLTAMVNIETKVEGVITYRVKGKSGEAADWIVEHPERTDAFNLEIFGLYPDYNNEIELYFKSPTGLTRDQYNFQIQTEPLPSELNYPITVKTNNLTEQDQSMYFVSSSRVAFDKFGDIRWYFSGLEGKDLNFLHKNNEGNFIVLGPPEIGKRSFYIVNSLGKILKKYDHVSAYDGIHHDIIQLEDGNYVFMSHAPGGNQDLIVEIDDETGEEVQQWNIREILDPDRYHKLSETSIDWLHANSIVYDPADGHFLISSRHQNAIFKIRKSDGALKWIIGPHEFWTAEFLPYLFTPLNFTEESWNWGQHAAQITPEGHILFYNNGNYRSYDADAVQQTYTEVQEFKIEESSMEIEKVWDWGKEKNLFTKWTGDVDQLENGHRLVGFMNPFQQQTPLIVEIDENDEIVFEAQFDVDEGHYRVEKVFFSD